MSAADDGWRRRIRGLYLAAHGLHRRFQAPFYRRRHVGQGTVIERSVHVLGWRSVRIGRNCVIGGGGVLNINNGKGLTRILIGDYTYVGRFSFFSNGEIIQLSEYCLIGPGCRFLGADHVYTDPFRPYIATGVTETGCILLGVNCWLGTDVTILGSVTVGHGSVLGAGAFVTKDVPPFSLVIGRPARVVKRYDMEAGAWVPVADFTAAMEALLPDEATYLETLRTNCPTIHMPYAAAGPALGDLA